MNNNQQTEKILNKQTNQTTTWASKQKSNNSKLIPRRRVPLENTHSATQELPCILYNWRYINVLTRAHHWYSILSKKNSVHILPSYFWKSHLTLALYVCLHLPTDLPISGFYAKILHAFSYLSYVHIPHLCLLPWFDNHSISIF